MLAFAAAALVARETEDEIAEDKLDDDRRRWLSLPVFVVVAVVAADADAVVTVLADEASRARCSV